MFSETTYNALLTQSIISVNKDDTALFISKVLIWWKILNVKSLQIDNLLNDPLQVTPDLILSLNLIKWLLIWLAVKLIVKKQFSQNTATAIHHTCNRIVSLCRQLLTTSHKYVLLGQFSTDPFENEFSKLHQQSGGTYFINV